MTPRSVTDPQGRGWRIELHLLRAPRRRRIEPPFDGWDGLDGVGPPLGDGLGGLVLSVVAAVALTALVAVLIALFLPAILFLVEAVIALGLAGWGAASGRRTVVAASEAGHLEWTAHGRREAARIVDAIATGLAAGTELPPPDRVTAVGGISRMRWGSRRRRSRPMPTECP